jgi:hypothetical protein
VDIIWYSGYKGEERPKTIVVNGEKLLVKRVISEKLVEERAGKRKRIFIVETSKGLYEIIKYQ